MSAISLQPSADPQQTITAYLYDPEYLTPFILEHPRFAKKYTFPLRNLTVHHTPLFERFFILVSKKEREALPDIYKRTGWTKLLKAHYYLFGKEDCPPDFPADERETKVQNLEKSLSILRKKHPILYPTKPSCFTFLTSFFTNWKISAEELNSTEEVTALCQSYLGYFYDSGIGTPKNMEDAAISHHLAVLRKGVMSHFFLANHYWHESLPDMAIPHFEIAAKAGYTPAQSRLGYVYSYKSMTDRAYLANALEWNKRAADQGDRVGQDNLGYLYDSNDDLSIDPDQIEQLYKLSATQGYTTAQHNLGQFYINHNRPHEAIPYLEMAAQRFNIESMVLLSNCYHSGIGTEVNYEKAAALYTIGAARDDPRFINNLAFCYETGIGVEKDLDRAIELYKRAIAHDHPGAFYNYAQLHFYGMGIPKNIPEAFSLYKRAADEDHKPAQYMVGALLYRSNGEIPQDLPEAIRYFKMHYEGEQTSYSNPIRISNFPRTGYSRNEFLNSSRALPAHKLPLYIQAHLYLIKGPFLPFATYENAQNMDVQKIKEIYDLLFTDLDRAWDLLPEDTLRDFIYQLSRLMERVYYFNPENNASNEAEIAESYLKDLKLPAKKSTLRQRTASTKKQNTYSPAVSIKFVPTPQAQVKAEPSAPINSNLNPMPAPQKPKKAPKKPQAPKTDNFEDYKAHIQKVLTDLKKRETTMRHFYLKNCDGQVRKLMQALFDKDDMTITDVNKLIEHLAKKYNGETRQGSRTGGMLILKIGDLTTGGHAPHGGKTDVDKGALADLRQLLTSYFARNI